MSFIKNILTFAFALSVAGTSFADDREQPSDLPDTVTLRSFAHAGSGCPAGTVQGNFPVAGTDFLILWDGFAAQAGQGIPVRDSRKNCALNLDLDYTTGWQYTVESVEYSGSVDVAADTQAIAGSYYYFQGDQTTIRFNTTFDGPATRTYQIRDTTTAADQVWSTCDATRSLNLNFSVRLANAASTAATGSISFGVGNTAGTFLKLKWRRCAEIVQ